MARSKPGGSVKPRRGGGKTNGHSVNGVDDSLGDDRKAGEWGRAWSVDWFSLLAVITLLSTCPLMVFYFHVACTHYDCALTSPILGLINGEVTLTQLLSQLPPITAKGFLIVLPWVAFQVFLYHVPDVLHYILPGYVGGICPGAITPSGVQLQYRVNGLQAWFISNGLFLANGLYFHWFPSTFVNHWGEMLWVANILGYIVAIFVFIKANYFPSGVNDCKYSGNILYDFMMGIEFNPRIGKWFDFKLFFNGRPGIAAWTIINMSFAFYQYHTYGYVTNSMWIVNILHAMYVVDFFWNEAWYLNTIDIHHDHFGWYLAWGDCVWLPWMYTLQGFYLAYKPVDLPMPLAAGIMALGLGGYFIFRAVNHQKDYFRRTNGEGLIWGKKPEYLEAKYYSGDGKQRRSKLLLSGWWGVTRHMNYTGDLMGCTAYCLACGFDNILPYFYLVFMLILLIHRCVRDEHRCKAKYGQVWDEYMKRVPCRLIPGIF